LTVAPTKVLFVNARQRDLAAIIEEFTERYPNRNTRNDARRMLMQLFRYSGKTHPATLTEADLVRWVTHDTPANNTVYTRGSKARTFLRWCEKNGYVTTNVGDALAERDHPVHSTYHRTYGKVQSKNPGRWLTHEEAYGQLLAACHDGTIAGLRDEIALRFGLMGMRDHEIRGLKIADLRHLPTITWTGKGHKPRQAVAGTTLVALLKQYLTEYARHVETLPPDFPVICAQSAGRNRMKNPPLNWGTPHSTHGMWSATTRRAEKAGLGHVAPHDLRRTAAGILHRATDEHGAHHFDLLDIQKVLGHSDPATTMRSYLDPMDTDVLDRASRFLD
jgi:integrase